MKLFGQQLFNKRTTDVLYDFAQHGLLRGTSNMGAYADYISVEGAVVAQRVDELEAKLKGKKPKKVVPPKELTPKELYNLKTLHVADLQIICDKDYLDENIIVLKQKLGLLPPTPKVKRRIWPGGPVYQEIGDGSSAQTRYGRLELSSIVLLLENRRSYSEFEEDFNDWPYTTSERISKVLNDHKNLDVKDARPMIPDLPKEACKQIERYDKAVYKLCERRSVYYLIYEKKQQSDVARRRDPILLAQSPFGFFWQILGAWDKEVVYLEEL